MIRPRSHLRAAAAALAICVLGIGSMAGMAEAKPPMAVTFHASYGVCVHGTSNRKIEDLDLYPIVNGHGQLVEADYHVTVHPDHSYRVCFGHTIRPGMALDAAAYSGDHVSWLIPAIKLRIDRVSDVVRGSAGTTEPSYGLTVTVLQCSVVRIGGPCPQVVKRSVTADSSGHYRTDLTSKYDLRGGDEVSVTYRSTSFGTTGDTYRLEQASPYMWIQTGSKTISSFINPKQTATYRLRTAHGGSLLSSVTATGVNHGQINAAFSEYPAGGNEVSSDFASDATFVIPSTATTFPIDSHGNQTIKTHCFPGLPLSINWEGGGTGYAIVTADSHGRATLDLATQVAPGFHLAQDSGRVTCIADTGDSISHSHLVP